MHASNERPNASTKRPRQAGLLLSIICAATLSACGGQTVVQQKAPPYPPVPDALNRMPLNADLVPDSARPLRYRQSSARPD